MTIKLDTKDEITMAGARMLGLRYALDAGQALTAEEQRLAVAIAYAALLRLTPRPEPPRWTDDSRGPVPTWLRELQEGTER